MKQNAVDKNAKMLPGKQLLEKLPHEKPPHEKPSRERLQQKRLPPKRSLHARSLHEKTLIVLSKNDLIGQPANAKESGESVKDKRHERHARLSADDVAKSESSKIVGTKNLSLGVSL